MREYDVVDVAYQWNPQINTSDSHSILVTRSVLLPLHLKTINIPKPSNPLRKLRDALRRRGNSPTNFGKIQLQLDSSDAISIPTQSDRDALLHSGINPRKIILQEYGLTRERSAALCTRDIGKQDTVAFLGTFDYRKGCLDLPKIFKQLLLAYPHLSFTLLGAKGLFTTERCIRRRFSRDVQERLAITLEFEPSALPHLLRDVALTIFPSYWEGCPFAVLESLAAGIPVIAYDSPGSKDILPAKWLARAGDADGLMALARSMLSAGNAAAARNESLAIASRYSWEAIGKKLLTDYEAIARQKRDFAVS